MWFDAILIALLVLRASASTIRITHQVNLDGIDYFLPPNPTWSLPEWSQKNITHLGNEFQPLTVVQTSDLKITTQSLGAIIETYNSTDDVWSPRFAQVIYVQYLGTNRPETVDIYAGSFAPELSVETLLYSWSDGLTNRTVPSGPYFVHIYTGKVYEAYRLYPDTNQAFIQASYQDPDGLHTNLAAGTQSAGGLSIAVPSRLYFTRTKERPIAGLRLGIKDLYDLRGLKTSGGNRALYELNAPANASAVAVQKLIDAGAIVVGKNKLSELAFAGPYHLDHIDYLLPFNPRGDGYNSPSDSSGGSAASVASYDWLDASMGSDTGGSIRAPAVANGVYGNRPSQGAVDLTGAIPLSTSMETSGTFARDPAVWSAVNKALYAGYAKEYAAFPKKIYWASSWTLADVANDASNNDGDAIVFQKFFKELDDFFGNGFVFVDGSLDDLWNSTGALAANNISLADSVTNVYRLLVRYEQYHSFGKDYLAAFAAANDGTLPYMAPNTLLGWQNYSTTSIDDYQTMLQVKKTVEQFADEHVFASDDDTCSDAIWMYPNWSNSFYKPDFDPYGVIGDLNSHDPSPFVRQKMAERDQLYLTVQQLNATVQQLNATLHGQNMTTNSTSSDSTSPSRVAVGRFSSVAGIADYALIIGSATLNNFSNRTQRLQELPIGIDFMTRRGCDFMLQNLISALAEKGILSVVKTGSLIH